MDSWPRFRFEGVSTDMAETVALCVFACFFIFVFFRAEFWVIFFFTSYSPAPCVSVIGLSHSHWPRCQLSVHHCQTFSRTSEARKGKRRRMMCWAAWGQGCTDISGPKLHLMWEDITVSFQKRYRLCNQHKSDTAATPWLTSKAVFLFVLNTMIHTESGPHCSTVPRTRSLQCLTF